MALRTRSRETSGRMVGIGNVVVFTRMTGVAIRRSPRIHSCNVAIGALNGWMSAGKRKIRAAVVEEGWRPGSRVMAD